MTPDDTDTDEKPESRRLYHLCLTLGVIGTTIGVCSGLFWFGAQHFRNSAAYLSNQGSMYQLSLGVQNYHDATHGTLGPFHDDHGKLTSLPPNLADRLSWRVSILPYLDSDLFPQFNYSEAWNSPNNLPVSNTRLRIYADALDEPTNRTPFRVFYDNGALFDSDPTKCVRLNNIPDGASNTLLVVESTDQVRWAQFDEHRYDPAGPLPPLGRADRNTFLAAMADGSVRVVKKTVSPDTLRATITRAGNDAPGPDW